MALRSSTLNMNSMQTRPYFTLADRVKDAIHRPLRHLKQWVEPGGMEHSSQLPDMYRTHGNAAENFAATLTQSSFDMNIWHEMETVVHVQFGTVDNPVLIFTSDSTWRIVICMGPAVEDDSHAHEKMYYMLREGPMNRCQICGQCFKMVKLKKQFDEEDDYYQMMFSQISNFEIQEEDLQISLFNNFNDRMSHTIQSHPANRVYIMVDEDIKDRLLVDPAYRLEYFKKAGDAFISLQMAYQRVQQDLHLGYYKNPVQIGRSTYETWVDVERSIAKFDRIWNKVEKFSARKFADRANHERREKRRLAGMRQRQVENYTYFFGNLTEEEAQYRDYFQTDLENDPEDEKFDELVDEQNLVNSGSFNPALYDFVDNRLKNNIHESMDDVITQKIFKYKYRQFADHQAVYERRNNRMRERFFARALQRDPELEADLVNIYTEDEKKNSLAQLALDIQEYEDTSTIKTAPHRQYMLDESTQQYRDYFESDPEEIEFFEYLDNLPSKERVRFMEIFEDFTLPQHDFKGYSMIPKREFDPNMSYIQNFAHDLMDFKDRVRPMANDLAKIDSLHKYQKDDAHKVWEQVKDELLNIKSEYRADEMTGENKISERQREVIEFLNSMNAEQRLMLTERLVQEGQSEADVVQALEKVQQLGKTGIESGNESPQLDSQEEEVLKIMSDESEASAVESHNEEEHVEEEHVEQEQQKKKDEDLDNL